MKSSGYPLGKRRETARAVFRILQALLLLASAVSLICISAPLNEKVIPVDSMWSGGEFWNKRNSFHITQESPIAPIQLPGPLDVWAGSVQKEISMATPGGHDLRLTLKLLDSHNIYPPVINVEVNDIVTGTFRIQDGAGASNARWVSAGRPSSYSLIIPAEAFNRDDNSISLKSVEGSWVAISSIIIETLPRPYEFWRWIYPQDASKALPMFICGFWIISLFYDMTGQAPVFWKSAVMWGGMTSMVLFWVWAGIALMAAYIEQVTPVIARGSGRPDFEKGYYKRDAETGWVLKPGYRAVMQEKEGGASYLYFAVNQYGFRSFDSESDFPQEGSAILAGDSFVQGFWLSQKETLAHALSRRMDGGYVYNLGIGGYSTDQEYTTLKKWLGRIKAPWVILFYFNNDLRYNHTPYGFGQPKPLYPSVNGRLDFDGLKPLSISQFSDETNKRRQKETFCCLPWTQGNAWRKILLRSGKYFAQLLLDPLEFYHSATHDVSTTKIKYTPMSYELPLAKYMGSAALGAEWSLAFQYFDAMRDLSRKSGARFLIFFIPEVAQIVNGPAGGAYYPQKRFMELCKAGGFDCIEPTSKYALISREKNLFFMDDGHFSPDGVELAADLIHGYIKNQQSRKPGP